MASSCVVPLTVILEVAAELAREGDTERAMRLKRARDHIMQTLCPHDKGTHEVLYMSGVVVKCKACGLQINDLEVQQ